MQPETALVVHAETASVEQALLGTLLQHPELLDDYADMLRPYNFVEELHGAIFEAMCDRHLIGETVSISSLTARLGDREIVPGTSVRQYLAHLMVQHAGAVQSLSGNARAVLDASGMRELMRISEELQAHLRRGGIMDPLPVANELVGRLDTVIAEGLIDTSRPVMMSKASRQVLQNVYDVRSGKVPPGISYSIPSLDRMTRGGAQPGQLVILAGRPAMGKTAVAITMGLGAARNDVAVYNASLEMVAVDIAERAISAECYRMGHEIPYNKIAGAVELTDEELTAVELAQANLEELPYYIEQRSGLTLGQLTSGARRYFARQREKGRKRGLMVVDYLGLVKATDRYRGQRVQEVGEVTRGLKAFAKEIGVPIILLCQLNRAVEQRDDKHPLLSDLRDSGDIEQDADVVLFVYRDEYYLQMVDPRSLSGEEMEDHLRRMSENLNTLEIGVAKQRKGETGWIRNYCNIGCNTVNELRQAAA